MKIKFLGATNTVTGSKYLLTYRDKKILVDCGLFQGLKELRLKNWAEFPIKPTEIDSVILTHAHIDHSGYLPKLVKNGFRGKIYCTPATKQLCEILLPDAGYLMEEEARYANLKGFSKHSPALPLFTQQDAKDSLAFFHTVNFEKPFFLNNDLECKFIYGGHILGAAQVFLTWKEGNILFSGDLGRPGDPIMKPASLAPKNVKNLVIESTYGGRTHAKTDPLYALGEILNKTFRRNGTVIIPAFAVGRTQIMMYYLAQLKEKKIIPDIPIFLNSPMAISVTGIYCEMHSEHRLSETEIFNTCDIVRYVNREEESRNLNLKTGPMVIIAGSGMATGGRVLHHIRQFAPHPENLILFAGYQAAGTRGATLVGGGRAVKMHGQMVPINCEVINFDFLSAHADAEEMSDWLRQSKINPSKVFITHGEPTMSQLFSEKLKNQFNWDCLRPNYEEDFEL